MRVPVQSGLRTYGDVTTRTAVRAQVIGWSLIATLIALVVMTISLYPG